MSGLDVAALYREYRPLVYRYLRKRVPDRETAEDLTAETFVRVLRFADRYVEQGRLTSWLLTTAQRVWIDRRRRQRPECVPLDSVSEFGRATADAGSARHVDALAVGWALERLSPAQRRATVACDLEGASNGEVGERMGLTANAVKKYRYWARIKLREILEAVA